MIREKSREQMFYDWLARVEEAGHASEAFIFGASYGFHGLPKPGRWEFGYRRGYEAGERWRRWAEEEAA